MRFSREPIVGGIRHSSIELSHSITNTRVQVLTECTHRARAIARQRSLALGGVGGTQLAGSSHLQAAAGASRRDPTKAVDIRRDPSVSASKTRSGEDGKRVVVGYLDVEL